MSATRALHNRRHHNPGGDIRQDFVAAKPGASTVATPQRCRHDGLSVTATEARTSKIGSGDNRAKHRPLYMGTQRCNW